MTIDTIDTTRWSAEYSTEELTSFERELTGIEGSLDSLYEKIRELEHRVWQLERRADDIDEIARERIAEIEAENNV